jgi:sugar-specific transcriptional regulator TrmB
MESFEHESILKSFFNLTGYEAKAYLSLAGRSLTVSDISRKAGIPMPRVYDTVNSLLRKGLVKKKGDTFTAVRPSVGLKLVALEMESRFKIEQAKRLRAIDRMENAIGDNFSKEEESSVLLLAGIEKIGAAFLDILRNSKDVLFLVKKAAKMRETFIELLESERLKGKRIRIALDSSVDVRKEELSKLEKVGVEVKRVEGVIFDAMIGDSSNVIIGVPAASREPVEAFAIYVRNRDFAESVRNSLEQVWSSSSLQKS